jgi:glycosyltransferase family protein
MDEDNNISLSELTQMVSVCLDAIEKLNAESLEFKKYNQIFFELTNRLNIALKNDFVLSMRINNMKYELMDSEHIEKIHFPKFYDKEVTIDLIANKHCSMGRFGDGEFALMEGIYRQKFQRPDERLQKRLQEVIRTNEDKFLIAIADTYGNLDKYTEQVANGIRVYMTEETRAQHAKYIDTNRVYHDTYISRPYVAYKDNQTDAPKKRFDSLRHIWNGRDIIIIEGCQSRLGVGNDLFAQASKIERIEAPATNSFDKYDELLDASIKYAKPNTLFLIALGPTAGVLAYDLYKAGYQAIDIGHIDLEYEWFLNGTGKRCEVKGKYNNEVPNGDIVEDMHDPVYERQIIANVY